MGSTTPSKVWSWVTGQLLSRKQVSQINQDGYHKRKVSFPKNRYILFFCILDIINRHIEIYSMLYFLSPFLLALFLECIFTVYLHYYTITYFTILFLFPYSIIVPIVLTVITIIFDIIIVRYYYSSNSYYYWIVNIAFQRRQNKNKIIPLTMYFFENNNFVLQSASI